MKKLYVLLSIGLFIFLIIQFPHTMINPGELSEGHQKLNNECLSCHKPFAGIKNEKCIACHNLSTIGKDTIGKRHKTQFHQQLSNQLCSSCHSEHQGVFPVQPLSRFKHELLSETIIQNCNSCHKKPIDNLHKQVSTNCSSCHQTQNWKNLIPFDHEMLLNKSNCASCHQKPNDNFHTLTKDNCSSCHNTNKWVPSSFDHSAYFMLDQHHNTTCITCHSDANYSSYTCYGCHEHTENNMIAEHTEEGVYSIGNCASCHRSGNEHDLKKNLKSTNKEENEKD